jgi:hypothetical protein
MFCYVLPCNLKKCYRTRVPNLGDARGLKSVISWVHLYQWGDAIDVKGDADTKRLGTPALEQNGYKIVMSDWFQSNI